VLYICPYNAKEKRQSWQKTETVSISKRLCKEKKFRRYTVRSGKYSQRKSNDNCILTAAITIEVTYFTHQGKKITLSGALNEIGTRRTAIFVTNEAKVSVIEDILEISVALYSIVTFTIFYLDRI
jgi:hypothetical protein